MIEFCSISRAAIHENDILVLAENYYDANILNNADWVLAPYLAAPDVGNRSFDCDSQQDITAYTVAVHNSGVALATLKTIVEFSNKNRRILIGCYASNVKSSHLSCLYDIMEDLFVDDDPDMNIVGG